MDSRIFHALSAYMSPLNARALLRRIESQVSRGARGAGNDELIDALLEDTGIFVNRGSADELRTKLSSLRADPKKVAGFNIEIKAEMDVSSARLAARELCEALGARRLATQQVATAVSELARNIALYTPGGSIELKPLGGNPPRVRIVAEDRGGGIPNLKAVLDGTYRSQTGLGKGLLGVKRLMDRFDVRTGPRGTRIEAEGALGFQVGGNSE
jgi:serine/threonine-protein kinase RsbT